jgi:hypothetical protein
MEAKAIRGILSQKSNFSFCGGPPQQNCDVQHFPGTKGLIVGLEAVWLFFPRSKSATRMLLLLCLYSFQNSQLRLSQAPARAGISVATNHTGSPFASI